MSIILYVRSTGICQNGQFNEEAKSSKECLNCFCFGASTSCRSSNMYRVALNSSLLSAHVFERSNHGSYKDVSNNYSPMHVRKTSISIRRDLVWGKTDTFEQALISLLQHLNEVEIFFF